MRSLHDIVEDFNKHGFFSLPRDEMKIISEMATIGWFHEAKPSVKPIGGELKVFINGQEGRIPHMHIWDEATEGKQFHACVMLEKPCYFNHGTKNSKFSKRQLKAFIDFLQDNDEEFESISNWKMILREWNKANKQQKHIDLLMPMPDYTKLN